MLNIAFDNNKAALSNTVVSGFVIFIIQYAPKHIPIFHEMKHYLVFVFLFLHIHYLMS